MAKKNTLTEKTEKWGAQFAELCSLMARLRAPGGCPWDSAQTHQSLGRYLLEEVYEFLEAVETDDDSAMVDELGDILLQVVFHAQIAAEHKRFDIGKAIDSINQKLRRRHPHVFGQASAKNPEQVEKLWEQAKAQDKPPEQALNSLPKGLPPLLRALRAGERMANLGFDWENPDRVMDKVAEEMVELSEEMTERPSRQALEHEVGDMLFVIVQLARQLGVNPYDALNQATDRSLSRFSYVLAKLAERGKKPQDSDIDEMEALWQESKGEPGLR
jgi:tetrapyrrole methylase family protein/MazG family protein